jgi:cysteine desulfurase
MRPFFDESFGNPSSAHQHGRRARKALEDAREQIASLLDAYPDEVIFTSGATEANNLAILGLAGEPPGRLIASPIEHPCVIEPLRLLERRGFTLDWLPVDSTGAVGVPPSGGLRAPEPPEGGTSAPGDPRLLAVMLVNHETGVVQPVRELRQQSPAAFHCDAAQAVGKIDVRFHDMGVTSLSLSAHKFHGPKGIGALLLRRGTKLRPLLSGGHQQQGHRPGTEPVALVVGMALALDMACRERAQRTEDVQRLRDRFVAIVTEGASPVVVNGVAAIPFTLNVSFPGAKADALLMALDLAGVACSTGSACSSGSLLPSPVLRAMGVPDDVLHSAMRFSFSHLLSMDDVEEASRRVVQQVRLCRAAGVSPLCEMPCEKPGTAG